jgi:ribosomal protein S18 acetylase RimI-like enzyme
MSQRERTKFVVENWMLTKLLDFDRVKKDFDCGNKDLNDYFWNDASAHREELLSETYFLKEATVEDDFPVALISLANDTVRRQNIWDCLKLAETKKYPNYPAVKITRLGVAKPFQRKDIGSHMLNMIKKFFVTNNRTGCRLLTVDAYNEGNVLSFYILNGFQFISQKDKNKKQRAMFYDLKRLCKPSLPV